VPLLFLDISSTAEHWKRTVSEEAMQSLEMLNLCDLKGLGLERVEGVAVRLALRL
jgi:hypothetical protein